MEFLDIQRLMQERVYKEAQNAPKVNRSHTPSENDAGIKEKIKQGIEGLFKALKPGAKKCLIKKRKPANDQSKSAIQFERERISLFEERGVQKTIYRVNVADMSVTQNNAPLPVDAYSLIEAKLDGFIAYLNSTELKIDKAQEVGR